jgi:circadian clock protein KaiC
LAKSRGITSFFTALHNATSYDDESTQMEISTIADTWMRTSFRARGGERNRALTIIKSRGTSHSNQVRELILTSTGITLADVFSAGGDVLMGTARREKELEQAAIEQERQRREAKRLLESESEERALRLEIKRLEQKLEVRRADSALLKRGELDRISRQQVGADEIRGMRSADPTRETLE